MLMRWVLGVSGALVGLLLLVVYLVYLFLDMSYERRIEPRVNQANDYLSVHLVSWRQDAATVQSLAEFLSLPGRSRNAGAELNQRLSWQGVDLVETKAEFVPADDLRLFLGSEDWLSQYYVVPTSVDMGTGDMGTGPDADTDTDTDTDTDADTDILKALVGYDHWTIFSGEPWETEAADPEQLMLFTYPRVDGLILLARLRLNEGLKSDSASAIREVQHLARLMISSHHFGLTLMAIKLLEDAAVADKVYRERGLLSESQSVATLAAGQTRAMRRMLVLFPYFLNPLVDEELQDSVLAVPTNILSCAGWQGGINQILMYRHWLDERLPFERDDPARFDKLTAALSSSCDFGPSGQLWADRDWLPPWTRAADAAEHNKRRRSRAWNWLIDHGEDYPYSRKLVATSIAASVLIYDVEKEYETLGDRDARVVF